MQRHGTLFFKSHSKTSKFFIEYPFFAYLRLKKKCVQVAASNTTQVFLIFKKNHPTFMRKHRKFNNFFVTLNAIFKVKLHQIFFADMAYN